ncbi:MAG: dTMP kinase [Acidimicrobiia bacterium]|nr:dTMP kinase [bacterium]MXX65106.1 dTMP kinase [Acidimicrobiia bacterium]MCY3579256.1 dTMP kinase [bacterium]MDE0643827.1 dTMP kinase [bacterium]MXZ07710.1 dTMP kinase [Acidimicrobiia bacterium]
MAEGNSPPDRSPRPTTNRYVALEGIDGAGKTRLVKELARLLAEDGQEVEIVREPGGTAVGEGLRKVLLDGSSVSPWAEAYLFAAARAQLVDEVVRPALRKGAWVLSDRSVYSSLAYQGAGRGLGIEEVKRINQPGLEGTWPALVILLDLDPRTGLIRQAQPDRIGSMGTSFLAAVAEGYRHLARQEPHRFVEIDAGHPLEEVISSAWQSIRAVQK